MSVPGAKLSSNVLREVVHPLTGSGSRLRSGALTRRMPLSLYSAKQHMAHMSSIVSAPKSPND
jgi:hypothetical protein